MKKVLVLVSVLMALLVSSLPVTAAETADFDYSLFATKTALPGFHPTAKSEEATAEYDQEPVETNKITVARVRVGYHGWMNDHTMLMEISTMPTPAGTMVKVEVLQDSNMLSIKHPDFERWTLLSELGWE